MVDLTQINIDGGDKDKKKRKIFLIAAISVLSVAIAVSAVFIIDNALASKENPERILEFGTIVNGVSIGGIDISGMDEQQARAATEHIPDQLLSVHMLSFDIDGALTSIGAKELGLTTDHEEVLSRCVRFGRSGGFEDRLAEIEKAANGEAAFDIAVCAHEDSIKTALLEQYQVFNNDAKDATYIFMPNGYLEDGTPFEHAFDGKAIAHPQTLVRIPADQKPNPLRYQYWRKTKYVEQIPTDADIARFLYIEEEKGLKTDMDALAALIVKAVENGDFSSTIAAPTSVTEPTVTVEQVKAKTQLVSSWTTWYGHSSNKNRAWNVGKLASLINGTVLEPNVQWSINKNIGHRTVAGGFKPAAALKDGRTIEDDVGGGVCQVSSTLFNAALRSDIKTPIHNRHTIPSVYLPIALDAAISSTPDLALLNEHEVPVFIVSYLDYKNKNITFEIYGPTVVHETYGDVILHFTGAKTGTGAMPGTDEYRDQTQTPDGKPVPANGKVDYVKPRPAIYCKATIHYFDLTGKELGSKLFYNSSYPSFRGKVYHGVITTPPPGEEGEGEE